MTTRSVLGLLYIAKAYREQGLAVDELMSAHGLAIDHIDATARIERTKELQILDDILQLDSDETQGLNVGAQMGIGGYGPFSMLVLTSRNPYTAFQTGVKYQALTYVFGDIRLELLGEQSRLTLEPLSTPKHIERFLVCRDMAGTYRFMRDVFQMSGLSAPLNEVHFTMPPPKHTQAFENLFDCPIHFNQASNSIIFDTRLLRTEFSQANESAFELYRSQCDRQLLEASSHDDSISTSLQHYLSMFNYEIPSVVEAAHTFGMSERTLRRQLKAEDQSYQKILDKVRYNKAQDWLSHSRLSIEDIAIKLGYQEAAAFNHAFKRWSGSTPSSYRKQAQA